jgi:hypothetical protein
MQPPSGFVFARAADDVDVARNALEQSSSISPNFDHYEAGAAATLATELG